MTLWVVLYAVGAVQAAMLAPALWRRTANLSANRVLALWLALIALDLAVKALHMALPAAGFADAFRLSRLLPLAYPPLFFVYVRALTTGQGPVLRDFVHASWFLLTLAWLAWRALTGRTLPASGSWDAVWFDPLLYGVAIAYLAAAARAIQRHRRWLRERRSDADRLSLRWLVVMAACQLVIWGIALAHWQLRLPGIDYRLIYAAVAPPDDDPRSDEVEARLSELMSTHALYREPALTIAQLARRSGYPEYLVSVVINRRMGGNFWDYVNRYRVEAVRTCLADVGDTRSILDLAYDAGFTSKSTFNTAFKRIVGETPSAYRRRQPEAAPAPR